MAKRDYFEALAAYQALLAQDPANRIALRGKILTLARRRHGLFMYRTRIVL